MNARLVLLALFLLIAPAARAQVGADWTAATGGSIRPGYDLNSCSAANSGALRYNTTVNQFQVRYGSGGWATLADASGTTPFYTDRITSGTAGVFVSDTGIVNFRTSGVTTGYFDTAGLLVVPGISVTTANGISSTNGYFSGTIGVGTNQPSATLHIMGGFGGSDVIRLSRPDTSNVYWIGIANNAFNIYNEAPAGTARVLNFMLNSTGLLIGVLPNSQASVPSTTLHVSGTVRVTSWTMLNANVTPTVPLEVSGTVSATAFVGNGSGLTNLNVQGDRITSGTAGVFVSNTGIINLRTSGVTTGYFDASGLLVTPGISITTANGISSTYGYFGRDLSVNGVINVVSNSNNVLVGLNAGANTLASYTTALGFEAARYNSTNAMQSTAIGYRSAYSNVGLQGSFLGLESGMYNSGTAVVGIGVGTAKYNSASGVASVGAYAGGFNKGHFSTLLGYAAGANNTADNATAVGNPAARDNTGKFVVALGANAAVSNTFNNVVALGYASTPNNSNQVVLGNTSTVEVTTSGVILAAGVSTTGTISATAFVGNGAGLTNLNIQGDRITSGTAGVFVSSTGIINLRTSGVTTGYFDASGLLVTPGISITTANGISSTNGYFSGAVVNAPQANAGTSIDWSRGNVQYTSASCGAFTFTNMQDGGVYSLTVKGTTAGTCSFTQSGLTFRMPANHGMVSTGTMTFYTFTRSGSDVMVNWMPGY